MKIAAISDLHGHFGFDLPECDLLLIAGDICPDRVGRFWIRHEPELCVSWMNRNLIPWLAPQVYDKKIKRVLMTWGNHDWTETIPLPLELPENIELVVDGLVDVDGIKVWCSPWSNEFCGWAWMKDPKDLVKVYAEIPPDVDIIMSHQPPFYYGDLAPRHDGPGEHVGSYELLETIDRVQPKAVVCGHIHFGHGVYNYKDTTIYNVAVVDERYELVNKATEFILHKESA